MATVNAVVERGCSMLVHFDRAASASEIKEALKRWNVPVTQEKVDELISKVDADGDGNISFPEFVDGLARDLVSPGSIWGSVNSTAKTGGGYGRPLTSARRR